MSYVAVLRGNTVVDLVQVPAPGYIISGATCVDVPDDVVVVIGQVWDGQQFVALPEDPVPGLREQLTEANSAISMLSERLVANEDALMLLIMDTLEPPS